MYVFKCSSISNRYGFTKDRTGGNLPCGDVCSGWDYFKQADLSKEPLIGIKNKEAIAAVEAQGVYVCDAAITVTISDAPPPGR